MSDDRGTNRQEGRRLLVFASVVVNGSTTRVRVSVVPDGGLEWGLERLFGRSVEMLAPRADSRTPIHPSSAQVRQKMLL